MCDWKPGQRCSCHAALKLARMRAAYQGAHPGAPLPAPLAGPQTIAAAQADWQLARQEARWAAYAIRVAQGHEDPAVRASEMAKLSAYENAAIARGLAAQEAIDGIRATREATRDQHLAMHAAEVLEDQAGDTPAPTIPAGFNAAGFDGIGRFHATGGFRDNQGYDANGYDRAAFDRAGWNAAGRNAVTGTRWSPDQRDQGGYDKSGFDDLGYHRTGTLTGPTGENAEQAAARRAQTTAPVPAATPTVVVTPQRDRLARYSQWNDRDDLVSAAAAAEFLGVDATGLAELTASGRMPVAVEGDGYRPDTYEFGSVLDAAGPLPAPPARVTRAMLQEHTRWRHGEELTRIGAWRVREAQRTNARVAAARVAA